MILRFSKYLATQLDCLKGENSFDVLDFWSKLRANYAKRGMCKSAVWSWSKIFRRVFHLNVRPFSWEFSPARALPLWVYCESTLRSRTHWMHYCQLRLKDLHREHKSHSCVKDSLGAFDIHDKSTNSGWWHLEIRKEALVSLRLLQITLHAA